MSTLKRALSFPFLAFYGTGMILGAGIYSVIGVAAADAGESLWISFLLAGFVAFLTGLSYAELASVFPKAGAEYVYLKKTFIKPRWLASSVGLVVVFAGVSTAATVVIAFAGYFSHFSDIPVTLVALGLILLVSVINIIGVKESAWMNAVFTLIEVGGLGIFIWFGFKSERIWVPLGSLGSLPQAIGTTGLVVFSYFGFENMVNLAEESKKPERDIPRAIFVSLSVATLVYVLVALSLVAMVDPSDLRSSRSPLTDAIKSMSASAGRSLGAIALFSTANTALIALVSTSRLIFSMGRDRQLPEILSRTLSTRKTPWVAAIVAGLLAAVLVPLGSVKILASVSSLATLLAFTLVNIALITLRRTSPKLKRPFRVPVSIGWLPIPTAVGIFTTLYLLTQFEMKVYLIAVPVILVSILSMILWNRSRGSTTSQVLKG